MLVKIAWRNIWRNKRRTWISISSITLGLTSLLFFVAMGDGVYYQMINDAVRMQAGHITFEHPTYREAPSVDLWIDQISQWRPQLDKNPRVEGTKLLILGQGVAKSGYGALGVSLMAIEPDHERLFSPLASKIKEGSYLENDDRAYIVIGDDLAKRLKLKLGRKLVLTTNDAHGALVEEVCRIKGIFDTGVDEIDGSLIHLPLSFGRHLFSLPPDTATQLGVVLKKSTHQKSMLARFQETLTEPNRAIYPWQKVMPELAGYIKVDKGSNLVFQGILIFLILFTIFNTILMSILERKKEFAVLLALGTEPRHLRRQLILETIFLTLMGCLLGLCCGGVLTGYLQLHGFDLSIFYDEGITVSGFAVSSRIYPRLSAGLVFWGTGIILLVTILLGLIPIRKAHQIPICDLLRSGK